MRIVFASVRYPPAPGGAETHVRALAAGMAARGHEVVVHTSDLRTEYPFAHQTMPPVLDGVAIVRHPARRLAGAWTVLPTLRKALMAQRADVLHAHSYGYYHTSVAASVARRRKLPFVFTPHYHPPWSMEGGAWRRTLRAAYDPLVGQRVVDAADRMIAVSTGELTEMRRHLRVPEAIVIPNGFHAAHFATVPDAAPFRERFGLGGSPLIVFAGRLASNKGLHHLLDAFSLLRLEGPREDHEARGVEGSASRASRSSRGPSTEPRLVLAGEDQGIGAKLRVRAKALGVLDRVTFTGHLDDATYRACLASASVFALPSEWEAFGIVLAEAMACGVPCVATRVGGAPDVVADGETGFLVPYGDAPALADRIGALLGDAELARRMGAAGRARALSTFSWDAVVERTLALYEDALTTTS